ncbi:DUF2793 domain-containing protein [Methylosinus sp. H3A]|uniref:DUF2793 domain-containing protein n=1 Tax=Methylosinus sp. H3A TaxID=2785786 RepID=UPI0018C1EDC0|nr:DUF2793 domain-containing protein [Methylosinus sp. H3A]MBG0810594.1 DUF2793 domain-containing protein [Methylosinus sp. H3A]
MTETIHLALPRIDAAQAQKHVTHNEALALLDAMTQLAVIEKRTFPPTAPAEGDRYLVIATATGAFAGKEQNVAVRLAGGWVFLTPKAGWLAYVEAEQTTLLYDGSAWVDAGLALRELQTLALLGLGATADSANPLSVKANAVLFAARTIAEGGAGDLRVKLVKEAAGHTVSQLYQSNWSGRAETGLIGDDDFHVKVSADGTTWREALIVDRATGRVAFPSGTGDGAPAAFRNRLRNVAFAVNQRAVSGTVTLAAGQYGHDGVKAGAAGASYTFSVSEIDTTLSVTAGSLILPIEAVLIEGGAYALAHDGTAQARVWQGTGYAGLGAYAPATRSAPLVVAGLTTGAQTNVEFSAGTILRPQFEPGGYATGFERRPPGVESAVCQRYYQPIIGWCGGWQVSSTQLSVAGAFAVPMRAAPTVMITTSATIIVQFGWSFQTALAITAAGVNGSGGYLDITTTTASMGSLGSIRDLGIFASAEI